MQSKGRSAIAPHVFAQVRSMKFEFKKLGRYRNTTSRNTQPLSVNIAHRLFSAYFTNFVIFQTETEKGIVYAARRPCSRKLTV